jgi:hypothetical protein
MEFEVGDIPGSGDFSSSEFVSCGVFLKVLGENFVGFQLRGSGTS